MFDEAAHKLVSQACFSGEREPWTDEPHIVAAPLVWYKKVGTREEWE